MSNEVKQPKWKILLIALIVIIGGLSISYYLYENSPKNVAKREASQSILKADKDMQDGKYLEAISLYNKAKGYKSDDYTNAQVKLANALIVSTEAYTKGEDAMNNKDYLNAIKLFDGVIKDDDKDYSKAQEDIKKCQDSYISENLLAINTDLKDGKFDDANKSISYILGVDKTNASALALQTKVKEAEAKVEAEAEAKQAKEAELKASTIGHFASENSYNIQTNKITNESDISGSDVFIKDIKGNQGTIDFSSQNSAGSIASNFSAKGTYVGNGEWIFKYDVTDIDGEYGIGVFKMDHGVGYITFDFEYEEPIFTGDNMYDIKREKSFTDADYKKLENENNDYYTEMYKLKK